MENPSFFKVMIGDEFRTTLRIPPQFRRYLGDEICDRSVVRSTQGRQWEIEMGVVDGHLLFQGGWESFISDNEISLGDFLVFFYDGDVGFDVKIYGTSGCEKAAFAHVPLKEVKVEEEFTEDSNDGKPFGCVSMNKEKASASVHRKGKEIVVATHSNVKKSNARKSRQSCKMLKSMKKTDNEKALKAAYSFKTPNPHFVTTCRNVHASSYMTIPMELVKEYNLDEKNIVMLRDPRGASWSVRLSTWRDGHRCLSTGWSLLYKRNHLMEGDACVLEFVQGGNAINVHIFRAKEYSARKSRKSGDRILTEDERRVLDVVKSFESSHPKFITMWRPTRFYHVPIPKKVAAEIGLKSNKVTTIFDPSGRSWSVHIIFRSYGQVELGIGWSGFCKGNNLSLGDICIFEFLDGANAIKVHIFRAAETSISAASPATDIMIPVHSPAAKTNLFITNPAIEMDISISNSAGDMDVCAAIPASGITMLGA